jgi:hypothetical protein
MTNKQTKRWKSGGTAELANASIIRSRDPDSNLGIGKILSDSVYIYIYESLTTLKWDFKSF